MITKEHLMNSIIRYADTEVIPMLPTMGKWAVGSMIVLAEPKGAQILDQLTSNSIIHSLGIVDDRGLIDEESLFTALRASASKYGKLEVSVPVIGTLSFSDRDIEKLDSYVKGGY